MCRLITLNLLHLKEMETDAPRQSRGIFFYYQDFADKGHIKSGLCVASPDLSQMN